MLKLFYMTDQKIKQKVQIVVTAEGSVLLLKLSEERGGFWQNATGSVENGERYVEAAQRELLEETGIKSAVDELPMELFFSDRWGFKVIEKVFHCHLLKKPEVTLSDEHQSFKWIPFEKIAASDYEFSSHLKAAFLARDNLK
jgi:8-oxo-dGTP pyrophosphatase MutT (NUDIX family)